MKLLFERSRPGRGNDLLPPCDVPVTQVDPSLLRGAPLRLPEIAEVDLGRHYTELAKQTHGVNDGFYPLGSCTMKYNPRVNEEAAAQPGFTQLHPLQPVETVQGALEVLATAERLLCEITGMDGMSFQPAAGSVFLALLRKVILLIPLIYILPYFLADKVFAVFLAEPVADFIAVSTTATLFYRQYKKL